MEGQLKFCPYKNGVQKKISLCIRGGGLKFKPYRRGGGGRGTHKVFTLYKKFYRGGEGAHNVSDP